METTHTIDITVSNTEFQAKMLAVLRDRFAYVDETENVSEDAAGHFNRACWNLEMFTQKLAQRVEFRNYTGNSSYDDSAKSIRPLKRKKF